MGKRKKNLITFCQFTQMNSDVGVSDNEVIKLIPSVGTGLEQYATSYCRLFDNDKIILASVVANVS